MLAGILKLYLKVIRYIGPNYGHKTSKIGWSLYLCLCCLLGCSVKARADYAPRKEMAGITAGMVKFSVMKFYMGVLHAIRHYFVFWYCFHLKFYLHSTNLSQR